MQEKNMGLDLEQGLQDTEFRNDYFEYKSRQETQENLRRMRKFRGMTKRALSDKLGLRHTTLVTRMEKRDDAQTRLDSFFKVAKALDCKLEIRLIPIEDIINNGEYL